MGRVGQTKRMEVPLYVIYLRELDFKILEAVRNFDVHEIPFSMFNITEEMFDKNGKEFLWSGKWTKETISFSLFCGHEKSGAAICRKLLVTECCLFQTFQYMHFP